MNWLDDWQGFYYDAFYGELGLNDDHFKQIEEAAKKAVDVWLFPHLKSLINKLLDLHILNHIVAASGVEVTFIFFFGLDDLEFNFDTCFS